MDTASYATSFAAVTVVMTSGNGVGLFGDAAGDALFNIENLEGSVFNDTLSGSGGANALSGNNGNDLLIGLGGNDTLDGGLGSDTASYATSSGAVAVSLSLGIGTGGNSGIDTLVSIENVTGSSFADTLLGSAVANVLDGGAGADTLHGMDGSDWASYQGSAAAVYVDLATGYARGGDAEGDTLVSIENLEGSEHNDVLIGGDGINSLLGMGGRDLLMGGWSADYLGGGNGNDVLKGGGGADLLAGGAGIDTASYDESGAGVNVSLMTNTGTGADAEGDILESIENLAGSDYRDILQGNNGANLLRGQDGNDVLMGMGGADTLEGGHGHDWLDGGTGGDTMSGGFDNDTYIVDHLWDTVIEYGGQGIDTVLTSVSWSLTAGADVEYLRTSNQSGTAAINLTGNASGNVIVGNDGNNIINGGGGSDEMRGRGGNDTYFVDSYDDVVIESGGQGVDAVRASVSYTLADGVDVETRRPPMRPARTRSTCTPIPAATW